MKHTKGPWKIIPNAENEFSLVIPSKYADAYGLDVEVGSIRHKHHAEMIVSAVNETNQNRRKLEAAEEMARAINENHYPVCAFCGAAYPDSHAEKWPVPKCGCRSADCKLPIVLAAWEKAGKGET